MKKNTCRFVHEKNILFMKIKNQNNDMKKTKLILIISFLGIAFNLYPQMIHQWERRFNLSSNNSQVSNDITSDALGNIYVTGYNAAGYSESDMVTIKYNSAGQYQWAKIYYNPSVAYSHERGKCIATYSNAGQNYIYAAGEVSYVGYTQYIILLKYDELGNQKWYKGIFLASFGYNHILKKVTADASGNVYVTGSTTDKMILVKYDSSGTQKIYTTYDNPPGYTFGQGNDIKVNSLGEIFIAGQVRDGSNLVIPTLTKFDPNGVIQYRKFFTGNYLGDNYSKVVLGNSFNVYIGFSGINDYGISKLNFAGDTLWTRRYNGNLNSNDNFNALAVDAAENVYATGRVNGLYGDIGTVKYDSSGNFQWVKTYAGPNGWADEGRDIKLDASGNIFVAGSIEASVGQKYLLLKYNPSGNLLWSREYDFAVNDYEDAIALTIDINGDPAATGSCGYITISDYATIKYNSSGTLQWAKKYNASQTSTDALNSIAADKWGNVYAIGRIRSGQVGDEIQIIKYNSAGVKKWEYAKGGISENVEDAGNAIVVDNNGYIYYTGTMHSTFAGNKREVWCAKLDSNGNSVIGYPGGWYFGGAGNDEGVEIALDTSNNFYVGYNSEISAGNVKFGVKKFLTSGTSQWTYGYSGSGSGIDQLRDMKVDKDGNVYLLGNTASALSGINIVIIKINSSGTMQWINTYNGTANGDDDARSVDVDLSGNVYICGSGLNTGTGNDIIAVKYNPSGNQIWEKKISNGNVLRETGSLIKYNAIDTCIEVVGDMEYFSRLNYYHIVLDTAGSGVGTVNANSYGNVKVYGGAVNDAGYIISAYSYDSSGSHQKGKIQCSIGSSSFNGSPEGDHLPARNEPVAVFGSSIYVGTTSFDTIYGNTMKIIKYKSPVYRLYFQALLQGFLYPGTNSMREDTVKITLRNSFSPYSIADSAKGLLDFEGHFFGIPFYNLTKDTPYYIVLSHRNSIETWSKTPVVLTPGISNESFKIQSNVFGDNVIQIPSSSDFAVYSGDVNQDGSVDLTDNTMIDNDSYNYVSGYVKTDITGDNNVDLSDAAIADNNAYNFVSVVKP